MVTCTNTQGSRTCGACPSGYTGNGMTCTDINECLTANGGCSTSPMVTCTNTQGSRTCGACPTGYTGNGIGADGCVSCGFSTSQWCAQSGTNTQYTKCGFVRDSGVTCDFPDIRYGSVVGGVPRKHPGNQLDTWCQQLGFTGLGTVRYTNRYCDAPRGGVFGSTGGDEPAWKWADWQDSRWRDQSLGFHNCGTSANTAEIASISCAQCGDGALTYGEETETVPGPFSSAPVSATTCRYDFSNVSQLFCTGSCSLNGASDGCDQFEADVLCRMRTGDPAARASAFTIGTGTAAPGFACSGNNNYLSYGTPIGIPTSRGVANQLSFFDVYPSSHIGGSVITAVTCTTDTTLCGNGVLDPFEERDPIGVQPFTSAPVSAVGCRYDFRNVNQFYCAGSCSLGGGPGCDQYEADVFCRLKLDQPNARATAFTTGGGIAAPGFTCSGGGNTYGTALPSMASRGVTDPIRMQDVFEASHIGGQSITSVTCVAD